MGLLQYGLHFQPCSMPGIVLLVKDLWKKGLSLVKKYCKIRKPLSFGFTLRYMHMPCSQAVGLTEVRREPTDFKQAGDISMLSGNSQSTPRSLPILPNRSSKQPFRIIQLVIS